MKSKLIVLFVIFTLPFRCANQNLVSYKYESLLYKYLNNYCKDSIIEKDYKLFTYRTIGVCQNCYRISMDSWLIKAYNEKGDYHLYVLFDNTSTLDKVKLKYKNNIKYLLEDHFVLDQYGFSITVPMLFIFNDNKLVNYIKYNRK